MKLKKAALAGTLESSDIQVTVEPDPGNGIHIELQSDVKAQFGKAIEATVREILEKFQVEDARVYLIDRGALDCTIRARLSCAICRGAETAYDWSREDELI